jgi:hypothetical protein
VSLFSGIAPPAALLDRIQHGGRPNGINHVDTNMSTTSLSSPVAAGPPLAAQPGPSSQGPSGAAPPSYEEPPPSYEDAMADNLRPADGHRPGYRPPDPATSGISTSGIWRDEKNGGD